MPVIADLEPVEGSRTPWGTWYHEFARGGEFKKAPGAYVYLSDVLGRAFIEQIKAGQPLPADFVDSLPVHRWR